MVKVKVELVKGGEDPEEFEVETLMIATGRRAFSDNLKAKEIGINFDK